MTWEPVEREVEAAAAAMCKLGEPDEMQQNYRKLPRTARDYWRNQGWDALQAVGPLIAARALRDMAAEVVEGAAADSPYNQGFALRLRRRADEIEREAR
jgi:hypothetical protein